MGSGKEEIGTEKKTAASFDLPRSKIAVLVSHISNIQSRLMHHSTNRTTVPNDCDKISPMKLPLPAQWPPIPISFWSLPPTIQLRQTPPTDFRRLARITNLKPLLAVLLSFRRHRHSLDRIHIVALIRRIGPTTTSMAAEEEPQACDRGKDGDCDADACACCRSRGETASARGCGGCPCRRR